MDLLPSEEWVKGRLSPIHHDLASCVRQAWLEYKETRNVVRPVPGQKRMRANLIWNYIADEARRRFVDSSDVEELVRYETVWFRYQGNVVFRFKKLSSDGYSRSYPTQACLAWHDDESDLFPDDVVCRVEVGYVLNEFETDIEDIRIVSRSGAAINWQYSIMDAAFQNIADVVDMRPGESERGERVAAVRLRKDKNQEDDDSSLAETN